MANNSDLDHDQPDHGNEDGGKTNDKTSESKVGSDFGSRGDRTERDTERNSCGYSSNSEKNLADIIEKSTCDKNDLHNDFLSSGGGNKEISSTKPDFTFSADTSTKEFQKNGNSVERVAAIACEQYDKMLKGSPSNMKDMFSPVSGACKMVETRVEMINTNNATPGYDKYFHCMGNCKAAEYGIGGAAGALAMDSAKEAKDLVTNSFKGGVEFSISDSKGDFRANIDGLRGGLSGRRCHDVCRDYLPQRYR